MALMGSALGSEVGLQLLLSPVTSNVVMKTACTVVGIGFPVYSTFKAIEGKERKEQEKWLVYWAAFGCFSVAEIFADKLLSWFPLYYHAKFIFLIWLQLPNNYGARKVYISLLRPLLIKHQTRLDRIVDGTRDDMNKFIVRHQPEIEAVKRTTCKIAVSVYRAAEEAIEVLRLPEGSPAAPQASSVQGASPGTDVPPVSEDSGWVEVPRDTPTVPAVRRHSEE
eukprot:TRINITY_DN14853_c0_g1_i1.p1 TRINITY_DN14853_c0_g1~~TRINITY_DN14853_c0_g1_i1.p1  ORF type:complete len:223 (+),score=38.96 TRINITY_DN14853_c0_g1_i1:32-700(+)